MHGEPDASLRSRYLGFARASVLAPLCLTSCHVAVLDPQGPIGLADETILIDSVIIMLAIVIPTIAATGLFAWWFRASNTKATYLPSFDYSGRIELVVWGIPLLVITLLGGVAWIGAHELDPAQPLASKTPPLEIQAVSLDWKWLFIYPDQRIASVNELVIPAAAVPVSLLAHVGQRDECVLHPAARQHDLHHEPHDDAVEPARRSTRNLPRHFEPLQRRRFFQHAFRRACAAAGAIHRLDRRHPDVRPRSQRPELYFARNADVEHRRASVHLPFGTRPAYAQQIVTQRTALPDPGPTSKVVPT